MSTPTFQCPHCSSLIAPASVNLARQIGTCGSCGRLVDLQLQLAAPSAPVGDAPAEAPRVRIRSPVALPPGLAIREENATFGAGGTVVVSRRWLRSKHFIMLLLFLAGSGAIVYLWRQNGASAWLIIGGLVLVGLDYLLLAMFVNTTVVRANRESVSVTTGPVPTPFGTNVVVPASELRQLYAAEREGRFTVRAVKNDGADIGLVEFLVGSEQALFIEQQLERVLGLVDFEIPGELGSGGLPAPVAGPEQMPAKRGALAALSMPLLVAGGIGLFLFIGRSEAKGTLTATLDGKEIEFVADSCESGQRAGFAGVELSPKEGESVVRLVQDPVRGYVATIADSSESAPRVAIESKTCARFDLDVHGTSTTINDIRVVEGSATIECEGLSGNVVFAGCH